MAARSWHQPPVGCLKPIHAFLFEGLSYFSMYLSVLLHERILTLGPLLNHQKERVECLESLGLVAEQELEGRDLLGREGRIR